MTYYEFWYADDLGNRITNITNVTQFEYVKVAGDVGFLALNTPLQGSLWETNQVDRRIHVYRQPIGGSLKLDFVAFLQKFNYSTMRGGGSQFSTEGHGPNGLTERRINAFSSEHSNSEYDYSIGQAIRIALGRNLGSFGSNPDVRNISGNYYDEASAFDFGANIKSKVAWKPLLQILKKFQQASKNQGTEIFWGIIPISDTYLEARFFKNQIGVDRSVGGSGNPVVFSTENGNLVEVDLQYDWSDVASYIYVGGKGEGANRNIEEVEDTARSGQSYWGRREKFRNATFIDIDDTESLNDVGQSELAKFRPQITLQGSMIDTPSFRYGVDWDFGDKVTISHAGFQANTVIRAVHIRVDGTGRETISSKVELDL